MTQDLQSESVGARLVRGDEEAWTFVLKKLVPKARAAIHRKFGPMWRSMDDEEMVNSAYRTIFRHLKEDHFAKGLITWDDFERLLVVVASRKAIDVLRKTSAEARRETEKAKDDRKKAEKEFSVLLDMYKTEWDQAIQKLMTSLFDDLEDQTERLIFVGKLNGLNGKEIAETIKKTMGGNPTEYMVSRHWTKICARFVRLYSGLPQ